MITQYSTWDIPEYVSPSPNYATLRHYLLKQQADVRGFDTHRVLPSASATPLSFDVRSSAFVRKQMLTTSLLSFIYYESGTILHDEITPPEMFGDLISNNTGLRSNSIGKSMVAYLLGHAICDGYIESLDSRLNDWPAIENTLYFNQRLIDLLNMRAADFEHVHDVKGLLSSGRWYNVHSVGSFARNELKNTSPATGPRARRYHYNGLVTNVLMNYLIYRIGSDFQAFINRVFRDKIGILNPVYFFRNRGFSQVDGPSWYMFYASRYDYLRISKSILDDWNINNCVGKYLRELYRRRESKGESSHFRARFDSASYGGQFHMDYRRLRGRTVFGMDGYGGQSILIDMDNNRIVLSHSIHTDYDWERTVLAAIRNGGLRG